MSIKSAKFSFVRFEHPEDNDYSLDIPYSLPAFDQHKIAFQFIVDDDRAISAPIKLGIADDSGSLLSVIAGPVYAAIVAYRYRFTGLNTYSNFTLTSIVVDTVTKTYSSVTVTPETFAQVLFDDFGIDLVDDYIVLDSNVTVTISATYAASPTTFNGTITPVWHQGFIAVSGVTIDDDCFTYALLNNDNSVIGYSNRFKLVDEEAFTSLVTYYCNEDGFEFFYPAATKANIVRLPFYLNQPQYPKSRTVDRKSDGSKRVLSSFVEKEYLIQTEQMPEVFHECMAIMLSHDNLSIHNPNIREVDVDVVETDNYSPKWEIEEGTEKQLPFGKGSGKVKVANYGYSNSNC
jgi:hypothetical protein